MRHTYVSRLVRHGVGVKVAQELARHSDLKLTLGIYAHADLRERAEAVARVPLEAPSGRCAHRCALSAHLAAKSDKYWHEDALDIEAEGAIISSLGAKSWHAESIPGAATERWLSGRKRRIANPVVGE